MSPRLHNKRCLIVGGTSGLGLAAAARFLEEGARVMISGRSPEKADDALRQLAAHGGRVTHLACDASVSQQVDRLFQQMKADLGGLDILYHVAGISGRRYGDGPLHECTEAGWQATVDANLRSVF